MESLGDVLKRLTLTNSYDDTGTLPEESTPTEVDCPTCEGRKWVRLDVPFNDSRFGNIVPCSCQEQPLESQLHTRLRRFSNLGPLSEITFATLDISGNSTDTQRQQSYQEAYQAATEYAENPYQWLLFLGPIGSGKTHLLASIVNRCLELRTSALYISIPDLLDHLRSAYAPGSDVTYDELFDHVRNVPVLALDDLGTHSSTPWAQEKLNQILNHRFNRLLPTVIAVGSPLNRLDEQLRIRLDDRTNVQHKVLREFLPSINWRLDRYRSEVLPQKTFARFDTRGGNGNKRARESLESAQSAAQSFARQPTGWLIFTGTTGSGKTHLAAAIVNELEQRGIVVPFLLVPDLLDYLRSTFSPQSLIPYDQAFENVLTTPILVLDDLGAHNSTRWAMEKLHQLMVHRHEAKLPTVITIHGFLEGEASSDSPLPESVQSRLRDLSLVTWIPIVAPDFRNLEQLSQTETSQTQRTYRNPRRQF